MTNPFSEEHVKAMREAVGLCDLRGFAERVRQERLEGIDEKLTALHRALFHGACVPVSSLCHIKREDYIGRAAALAGEIECLCAAAERAKEPTDGR